LQTQCCVRAASQATALTACATARLATGEEAQRGGGEVYVFWGGGVSAKTYERGGGHFVYPQVVSLCLQWVVPSCQQVLARGPFHYRILDIREWISARPR
jgi:hypothetical protein